jgi:hypothetical protein
MSKKLLLLALPFAVHAAFAQPSSSDPSTAKSGDVVIAQQKEAQPEPSTMGGGKSRADVKNEVRSSGSSASGNIEEQPDPSTVGSGKSRAEVKSEVRSSGSSAAGNLEVQPEPSTKGSGTSRADVKSETRATGSIGTKNIEVGPPTTK